MRFLRANETLRIGVYIASPSLSRVLDGWLETGSISDRAARRLLAYVVRAATRTTPFGMFAAVGRVGIGETTTLTITSELRTQTRPDMGWLSAILNRWKGDVTFREHLYVTVNDALIQRGGRYNAYHPSLVHRSRRDKPGLAYTSASFKATEPVKFLRERLRRAVSIADAAAMLEAQFAEDREECLRLLNVLWDGGFFIDELQLDPSADPMNSAIAACRRISEEHSQPIEALARELSAIDRVPPSSRSLANYHELEELQKSIDPLQEPKLQTDAMRSIGGVLGRQIFDDVAALVQVMLRWHPVALKRYRERFVERYEGTEREVPLLELVNPSLGLGVPDDLELASSLSRELIERRFALASQALLDGAHEVELDEQSLCALLPPRNDACLADSFDVGFEILAGSVSDLNAGRYRIVGSPFAYAPLAGASIGRFAKALGEQAMGDLRALAAKVEAIHSQAVVAELVVTPAQARGLNVSIRPVQMSHQIRVGVMHEDADSHVITPDDLVVGLDDFGFYLRSLSLNRRVEVVQTHVYNTAQLTPPLGRLLSLLAYDGVIFPHGFDWGPAENLSFLPRLRRGRIIVSKARWRFAKTELLNACAEDPDRQAFVRRWRLPRYVQLIEHDNALPVDLSTELGWEVLRDHVLTQRKESVFIEELLPCAEDMWIEDELGAKYRGEFVASFTRDSERTRLVPKGTPASRSDRLRAPGSEWTSFKLYVERDDQDRVLADELQPLLASLHSAGEADSWFYVRYADPAEHIRLRLMRTNGCFEEGMRGILRAIADLQAGGVLAEVTISTYHREIERYGGINGIAVCERIFAADSSYVLSALLNAGPVDDEQRLVFAATTIATIAIMCSQYLQRPPTAFIEYRRAGKMCDEERRMVRTIKAGLQDVECSFSSPLWQGVRELLDLEIEDKLERPFSAILNSLLHMHCNRCGIDSEAETRARAIARQAVHGVEVLSIARMLNESPSGDSVA